MRHVFSLAVGTSMNANAIASGSKKQQGITSAAKAWAFVAFAFLAVLALAILLFEHHRQKRLSALETQFEQNSSHISREIVLQYDNHRQVVDNVTRILSSATLVAADIRQRDVAEAQQAAAKAQRRAAEMAAMRDRSSQREVVPRARQKQARDGSPQTHDEVAHRARELEIANQAASRSWDDVVRADTEYHEKAQAVTAAQGKLDTTTKALDAVRAGAPSPHEPGAPARPSVRVKVAPQDAVKLARNERDLAAVQLETARGELALARERADGAWGAAVAAEAAANGAWDQLDEAMRVTAQTEEEQRAAKEAELQARKRRERVEPDYGALRFDRMKQNDAASQDLTSPSRALLEAYVTALNELVLPSQRKLIDDCRPAADLPSLELCVAQSFAGINSSQDAPLVMEKCPTKGRTASVSEDGRDLLVPPSHTTGEPAACGKLSIRQLLGGGRSGSSPSPTGAGDSGFDAVVLVRSDGTTLDSIASGSSLHISAIPGFGAAQATASSMLANVVLGASNYRIFSHPVGLRVTEGAVSSSGTTELVVCGLVSEARLAKAALQIGVHAYLWVVLLLAVALLSLPLAKLWLLGRRTQYRRFDVTVLASSSVLLTLLGVVFVLAFLAHNRLSRRSDRQLATAGQILATSLASDITASSRALRDFVSHPEIAPHLPGLLDRYTGKEAAASSEACTQIRGNDAPGIEFYDERSARGACEVTEHDRAGYPERWRLTFLMDRRGNQRVKIVPTLVPTTAVSLNNRLYFQRALRNDTACLEPGSAGCGGRGVPELVRSVTSGNTVLVVAQPVCTDSGACADDASRVGVAAIETRWDAHRNTVLPLGVQALVVNDAGTILLHSASEGHHGQSLFAEVDTPTELSAALAGRVPETITTNYFGQRSRLHIEPLQLPGAGLFVLALVPSDIVDVAATDMVMAALLGYVGLVVGALGIACLLLLVMRVAAGPRGGAFGAQDQAGRISLRPDIAFARDYADIGIRSLCWGAALCAAALVTTPGLPPTLGIAMTATVAAKTVWRVVRQRETPGVGRTPPGWRECLPLTYPLCVAGLAAIFVTAPAAFMFAGAYDHVVDNMVRSEQQHVASRLGRQLPCPAATTRAPAESLASPCISVAGVLEELPVEPAISALRWASQASLLWPMPYLAELLPPVGPAQGAANGRLYRRRTASTAGSLAIEHSSRREATSMVLVAGSNAMPASDAAPAATDRVLGITPLPRLVGIEYNWPGLATLILVVGVAVAAGHVIAFRSLRRLFFLDGIFAPSEREAAATGQSLLLSSRHGLRGRKLFVMYPTPGVRQHLSAEAGWRELAVSSVTNNIEVGRSDPDLAWVMHEWWSSTDALMLAQLDEVSRWMGTVAILAAQNPLEVAPSGPRSDWALLLERFEVIDLAANTEALRHDTVPPSATVVRMWCESDDEEQRLLTQLAIGGFVTPHPGNQSIIRRLVARGLLDAGTITFRLRQLEALAKQAFSSEQRMAWEESERGTGWAALRVPLSTGVAALLAAVTVSNPELGAASAAVPTLALGLPSILRAVLQLLAPDK